MEADFPVSCLKSLEFVLLRPVSSPSRRVIVLVTSLVRGQSSDAVKGHILRYKCVWPRVVTYVPVDHRRGTICVILYQEQASCTGFTPGTDMCCLMQYSTDRVVFDCRSGSEFLSKGLRNVQLQGVPEPTIAY